MKFFNSLLLKFELPKGLWRKIALIGLAVFFINVGIDHFINPDFYLSIMPPAFPLILNLITAFGLSSSQRKTPK